MLAEMMLDYKKGLCIAEHFRCVILEVLSRTTDLVLRSREEQQPRHLKFSVTLSRLLERLPYLLTFVLQYFKQLGPFFDDSKTTNAETAQIIETASRLLNFSPANFCSMWDWSPLCELGTLANSETQWCFLQALTVILKLKDEEKLMLLENVFGKQYLNPLSGDVGVQKFGQLCVNPLSNDFERTTSWHSGEKIKEIIFTEKDLCGKYTISAHMLLPRISDISDTSMDLVTVPSMLKNLEALSIGLVSQKAILLSGAVGCGKTSIVEYLAGMTGRGKAPFLLKVQLGDQTDSKVW